MNFKILFYCCILGFSLNGFGQDEEACSKVNDFSVEERNQNYPYNKASRIVFTSFKGNHGKLSGNKDKIDKKEKDVYMSGQAMREYFDMLKDDFSKYNPNYFEERFDLSEEQKNELTDLIFNFGNNAENAVMWAAACYMPRNAILFFDENDDLFEFIEICFECNRYRTSTDKIDLNNNCGKKLGLLKGLFVKAGIEYGTINNR